MQNFLASQHKKHFGASHMTRSGHFAFSDDDGLEEHKLEGADAINRVIDEQTETNYDDMVANNLVQFEYDIF